MTLSAINTGGQIQTTFVAMNVSVYERYLNYSYTTIVWTPPCEFMENNGKDKNLLPGTGLPTKEG